MQAEFSTERLSSLRTWLAQVDTSVGEVLCPIAGDASARRYFRLRGGAVDAVLMDSPSDLASVECFLRIADYLSAIGVGVPTVLAAERAEGWVLLEDLGDVDLKAALQRGDDPDDLYRSAIDELLRLQAGDRNARVRLDLPAYDEARLMAEMRLFVDWYLARDRGEMVDDRTRAALDAAFETIARQCEHQPSVLVHRDYHSRNLMLGEDGRIRMIDFQDALRGPVTYDLVSLIWDRYWDHPYRWRRYWMERYRREALKVGLEVPDEAEAFYRWCRWMALQRSLKVVGIFARLAYRDGKRDYLSMIPRFYGYCLSLAEGLPELQAMHGLLRRYAP